MTCSRSCRRGTKRRPSAPVLLLAAVLLCCSGASPAARSKPSDPQPRRVILLVIDGASVSTFRELHRRGLFDQGGFARFFRDGQVADALIPVHPTLSGTNHATLATGFPPGATGIVGNRYHPGGTPFTRTEDGFETAIGTETLWEAARRQGRRVAVSSWPGLDARDERRRADWGLVFKSEREPRVFSLARADWRTPGPGAALALASRSPLLAARVTIPGRGGSVAGPGSGELALDLYALDNTDDGRTNYDAVAVHGQLFDGGRRPLRVGEWGRANWTQPDGRASSALKLLSLAPDLARTWLFFGGTHRTAAYPATFAESFAGSGLHWPGPAFNNGLSDGWEGKPGIDLETWAEQSEQLMAFFGASLRQAAVRPDWDLLMCSIPVIDQAGHALLLVDERQPNFSAERRDSFARVRHRLWRALDAELRQLFAGLDLARTTVLVVGDHGMMPVHTAINPNAPLAELGLLVQESGDGGRPPGPAAYAVGNGGAAHIYLDIGGGDEAARRRLLADIAGRYAAWRVAGEAPVEKIFTRAEAARVGLDHANSGDLIVFVRKGFVMRSLPGGQVAVPAPLYGVHGHLSTHPEIQAIYLAVGAGVAPGRGGTVQATEVAPRVAAWLGIAPPRREAGATSTSGSAGAR